MSLWIILSLIGIVFLGVSSTAQKFVAEKYENRLWLFVQYLWMIIFAFLFVLIITKTEWIPMRPVRDLQSLLILLWVWIFWFIWILFLRKWFEKTNSWIVLVIANISTFLMYFANLYLFDSSENLPVIQVILAILFFWVISQFLIGKPVIRKTIKTTAKWTKQLISKWANPKISINKWALYPMVTAVCRAIFFVGNTYFVKNEILHPVQSVFFTEGIIFLIATIALIQAYKKWTIKAIKTIKLNHLRVYGISTLALVAGNFLMYYAYLDTAANIVNVIRLFSIVTTAIFARVILKDRMSKRNIVLMSIAFTILILFIFAEDLLKVFWIG